MKIYDVVPRAGLDPELGLLIAALDDSTREWRSNLELPPVEAIVYQPWPDAYSIGALILHMIDCELHWFEGFVAKKRRKKADSVLLLSDEVHQYGGRWPTPPAEPIEWYFDLQDRYRARSVAALVGEDPARVVERKNCSVSVRWVLAHVVEHDSYHGGQAVLLHEMWKARRRA